MRMRCPRNKKNMGLDKATGIDDIPIEAVKLLARQYIRYVVVDVMDQVI